MCCIDSISVDCNTNSSQTSEVSSLKNFLTKLILKETKKLGSLIADTKFQLIALVTQINQHNIDIKDLKGNVSNIEKRLKAVESKSSSLVSGVLDGSHGAVRIIT